MEGDLVIRNLFINFAVIFNNQIPNSMIRTIFCLAVALLFMNTIGEAQPQTNNWYFGNNAAVTFTSGSPVSVTGCAMSTNEGCATISDATGNLLFYTDGMSVYNRNNIQMSNGFGLGGNSSSTQSGVILQKPGSTTIYYIFTSDAMGGTFGLCYSIVDMTLNAGLGDVTIKNFNLLAFTAEKVTCVRHCNGTDVWMIAHGLDDNIYYAYLVSNTGVAAPVVSHVGTTYTNNSGYYEETIGYLKASPDGTRLAAAIWDSIDKVDILDFSNSTGVVSNPITIDYTNIGDPYGVSFSPNGHVLYVACWVSQLLYQYDLSSGNQATIIASQLQLATGTYPFSAIQLGLDGKLYVSRNGNTALDAINNPNIVGVGCNYTANAVTISGTCAGGLPNFVDAINASTTTSFLPSDTTVCVGPVTLNAGAGATTYLWSTGETTQTISVAATGIFSVIVTGFTTCGSNTQYDTVTVTILPAVTVNLGNDTTLCTGQTITLDAGNAGAAFVWSNGATTQTITVSTTSNYSVTVTAGTCSDIDTITVNFVAAPVVTLGADITVCAGIPVTIDAGNAGAAYLWSNGATTRTINPTTNGTYIVLASFGTCIATDTIQVTFTPLPIVNLGPDQSICNGQSVLLNAGNAGATYLWSDGSTTQTISVLNTGQYWVQVMNGTCIGSDTANVIIGSAPNINLGPDIYLCAGMDIALSVSNLGMLYSWSTGSTAQFIRVNASGEYIVKVNNNGCIGTDTVEVKIYPEVFVSLGADTFICPGTQIQIDAGKVFTSYAWSSGGNNHFIVIEQPGTYTVIVTDAHGCTGISSKLVREFCPNDLYIPSAFSPNGDRNNNKFMAYGVGVLGFHLYVFDRWGELIFETQDIAAGWDGTYNGANAPEGTYIYRVDYQLYEYLELIKHTKYGVVHLVR